MLPIIDSPFGQFARQTGAGFSKGLLDPLAQILQQRNQQQKNQDLLTSILSSYEGQNNPLEPALIDPRVLSNPQLQQSLLKSRESQLKGEEIGVKNLAELAKQSKIQMDFQREEQQSKSLDRVLEKRGFDLEDLSGLPIKAKEELFKASAKTPGRRSEKVWDIKFEGAVANEAQKADEVDRTKRILELIKKPGTSFDTFQGFIRNITKGTPLERFYPIPQNEAELQNLIIKGAPELKNTFGARVTNFDFSKWLEGQPGIRKTQLANFAIATMSYNKALMEQEINNTIIEAEDKFPENSKEAQKYVRERSKEIRDRYAEKVISALDDEKQKISSNNTIRKELQGKSTKELQEMLEEKRRSKK